MDIVTNQMRCHNPLMTSATPAFADPPLYCSGGLESSWNRWIKHVSPDFGMTGADASSQPKLLPPRPNQRLTAVRRAPRVWKTLMKLEANRSPENPPQLHHCPGKIVQPILRSNLRLYMSRSSRSVSLRPAMSGLFSSKVASTKPRLLA